MQSKYKNLTMLVIAAIAFMIFGTQASADRGMGYGHHGRMHGGGYGEPGPFGNLSEDEIKKLDEERTAFIEATKGLRQDVYQKKLELASELAKQNPDAAKAAALQKEISDVKAQLAQKHLDHFLRIRKINPDFGRGFGGGGWMGPEMMGSGMMHPGMMGSGMMHPGMMGRGGHGYRESYDCPYGDRDGGYGMGPGMMGSGGQRGMMKRGGWGHSDSRPYSRGQGSQSD